MNFINIIINNSQEKIAKLYNPATKANENPENGITIQNKSAYHVIKDCAYITKLYLPVLLFEKYKNPFVELKGKFKRSDILDFLTQARVDINYEHLLIIIKNKIPKNEGSIQSITKQNTLDIDPNDPYGDYGSPQDISIKSNDEMSDLDLLCSAFGVNN